MTDKSIEKQSTKEIQYSPEYFMGEALKEAHKALAIGEVPIGAVVVYHNNIVGRGFNRRETSKIATTHAEMTAIEMANKELGKWRLTDCDLYVTLEPCPMCSGAMILARVRHVYFGAFDPKAGAAGSLMNLLTDERFNHQPFVTGGVLKEECQALLKDFFKRLRSRNKADKAVREALKKSQLTGDDQ
ncbi:MAG: tRNA adenosine(34) deaminase TadA [Bavariicoccus seileri]|uniref:tRNA adenosine(34) deaminase TadA n=1 Tax=Bavariicoccus seileri TaxID=549685 RepID=UPI003F991125